MWPLMAPLAHAQPVACAAEGGRGLISSRPFPEGSGSIQVHVQVCGRLEASPGGHMLSRSPLSRKPLFPEAGWPSTARPSHQSKRHPAEVGAGTKEVFRDRPVQVKR